MSSTPNLKLYRRDGASSLIPHILLQHLGLPFTAIVLAPDANNKFAAADGSFTHAEYLNINPAGYVPALDVGGGVIVTEMPAILTYIVGLASSSVGIDKNEGDEGAKSAAGLLGGTLLERAQVAQWMAYLSGTLHSQGFGPIFRPERFVGGHTSAYEYVREMAREVVEVGLGRIEERLGSPGQRYIVGDGLTTVDFYLYMFYLWGGRIGIQMGTAYPSYTRLMREIESFEGVRKAAEAEGLKVAVKD